MPDLPPDGFLDTPPDGFVASDTPPDGFRSSPAPGPVTRMPVREPGLDLSKIEKPLQPLGFSAPLLPSGSEFTSGLGLGPRATKAVSFARELLPTSVADLALLYGGGRALGAGAKALGKLPLPTGRLPAQVQLAAEEMAQLLAKGGKKAKNVATAAADLLLGAAPTIGGEAALAVPKSIKPKVKPQVTQDAQDLIQIFTQGTDPGTRARAMAALEDIANAPETTAKAGQKIRGFIKTVKEAPGTPPEVAKTVQGTYDPFTDKAALEQANKIISADENAAYNLVKNSASPTKLSNTVGLRLIDKYNKAGKFDKSVDLIETMARPATEQGQSIQALSLYEKLTGPGVLRFTQKIFDKANALQPNLKLKLNPDLAAELSGLAEKIQGMEAGREKTVQTALLLKRITEQVPPTIGQKLSSIQTMSQLLFGKAGIRNIFGNVGFAGLENVKDLVAVPIDAATSLITGQRTKVLPDIGAQLRGLAYGAKVGTEDALLGINTGTGNTQMELPQRIVFKTGILSKLEKALNLTLRMPDRANFEAAYQGSLSEQMRARGLSSVKELTPDMHEQAAYDGLYRTFNDENVASKMFTGIKRALNNIGTKDFGLGDFVIKYAKTPANIAMRGIDYSPAGFLKTTMELAKPLIGKEFNQRAFVESAARGLTGTTGLIGTGAILHKLGIITGEKEKNRNVASLQRDTGLGDYKINVSALKRFVLGGFNPEDAKLREGDKLRNYDWFQPAAIGLSIGANINENKGQLKGTVGTVADSIMKGTETLSEQPFLQGIRKMTQSGSPVQGVIQVLKDVPASFVPTVVNNIRQFLDNQAHSTYDPNPLKEAWNRAIARVPGAAQTLPPKVGVFGENKQTYQGGTNTFFNTFLNPAFATTYAPSPEAKMVLDIYNKSGLVEQIPKEIEHKQKIQGVTRALTAKELEDLQRYVGTRVQGEFSKLAKDQLFLGLSDEVKAKKLGGILTDIGLEGKVKILGENPWLSPTQAPDGRMIDPPSQYLDGRKLSPEEYKSYLEASGKSLRENFAKLTGPNFENLPEKNKAKLVNSAVSASRLISKIPYVVPSELRALGIDPNIVPRDKYPAIHSFISQDLYKDKKLPDQTKKAIIERMLGIRR